MGIQVKRFSKEFDFEPEKCERCFLFQMHLSRAQDARRKKDLEDNPCKSAGLVEYSYFTEGVDPRIKTECTRYPPVPHPEELACARRFYMPDDIA